MTARHSHESSIQDVTTEDVYHAVAGDPYARPGIYLDRVTAGADGLSVTLSDDLDRSVTYSLTITHTEAEELLAERYGNLGLLLQEAPRC